MLKVEMLNSSNLTEEEKEEIYCDEYDTILKVTHNNKVIALESDGMEPEDVKFYRDLSWVPDLLEECYKLGRIDGFDEGYNSAGK